ncbi:MAG: hypothetical protein ACTSX9_09180 [Candidatus Njordarchaeales archaeon]
MSPIPFRRKAGSIDYELLLDVIIKIDMLRDLKITDPERLERMLLKTGVRGLREELRIIRREGDRLVSILVREKGLIRRIKIATILKILAITGVFILFGSVILIEFTRLAIFTIVFSYPFLLLFLVILPNAYLILDYYVRTDIQALKQRKRGGVKKCDENLRRANQSLINKLIEYAKKDGKKPKDLRFKTWHIDYANVRIVRKPWLLGKYWIVEPVIESDENE